MADNPRIEDLRRRVQKDPASIAFAQLAEELRRAGQFDDAVSVCRAGLAIHPAYVSARVTLGRALVALNRLAEGQTELQTALKGAPENLAAIRALADIHNRLGETSASLEHYRAALALARNDPDLERTVSNLSRQVQQSAADGVGFEHVQREVLKYVQPPARPSLVRPSPIAPSETRDDEVNGVALRQIATLERWLEAIHVVRTRRSA